MATDGLLVCKVQQMCNPFEVISFGLDFRFKVSSQERSTGDKFGG